MTNIVCGTCWGYGLHVLARTTPIDGDDAQNGMPSSRCPECSANPNPSTNPEQDLFDYAVRDLQERLSSPPEWAHRAVSIAFWAVYPERSRRLRRSLRRRGQRAQ